MEVQPQKSPVISLYLDARANQNGKHDYAPFVRKRLSEISRNYEPHSAARESFDEDFVRIERYLEDEPHPATKGIAIFACSAANDFFDVGEFEAAFEANDLHVSDRPHFFPLARIANQYPRCAVVLADNERAHILVFDSGRTIDRQDIENIDTKETRDSGWQETRYQSHEENSHLRHAKEVTKMLDRVAREENIDHIILAGDEETIIPLLREQMTKELADKIVDVMALPVNTPEQAVADESLTRMRRFNSLNNMQKVERLLNEYRADDLGVAGVTATLAALSNGQVQELLITADPANLKYDEGEVTKVLRAYRAQHEGPTKLDGKAIADELIWRAHKLSSARITMVEDATSLNELGGVGGILRYRVSTERAAPYEDASAVSRTESLVEA